jgi:hypothetical protein
MFVRCLTFFRNCASFAGLAALLLVARSSANCEEPTKSEKPAVTQEKKSILNFRAYRPSDSISGSPRVNEHLPTPTVPVAPPSRSSRQNQELLDRQKNWIFASPESEKKSDSAKGAFGVDESLLDDESSKSVVTKFLENRESKDAKTRANEARDKDQRNGLSDSKVLGAWNDKQNQDGNSLQQESFQKRFAEPGPRELSLSGLWREQNNPSSDKAREEKRIQMNEFRNLFSSQPVSSSGPNNPGLQPTDPFTSGGARYSTPFKTAPEAVRSLPRAGGGASAATTPNINTRVFGPSAAPAPATQTPRFAPQPSVLPIPKRRL